jgi:small-conductance mechanosensitive channel
MEESIIKWKDVIVPWLLHHGVKILLICLLAYILNLVLKKIITKAVRVMVVPDAMGSKEAEKKREDTLIRIFTGTLFVTIITLTILMVLPEFGVEIGPILAGAGIVGLAFGFGGQYLIRDLISGLFIILENQYRIGDVIKIDATGGLVEDISLRKTTLRDLDGTVHHIPHGEVKKVSNLSKNFARLNLNLGVAYNTNLDHVIRVVNQVGMEISEDPVFSDSILKPPQFLRVDDFADSAIVIKILGDTKPLKQWEVMGEYRKRIKIAFDREGIEIPFPQRVVHMASDERIENKDYK